jgi:hypothetical protein
MPSVPKQLKPLGSGSERYEELMHDSELMKKVLTADVRTSEQMSLDKFAQVV